MKRGLFSLKLSGKLHPFFQKFGQTTPLFSKIRANSTPFFKNSVEVHPFFRKFWQSPPPWNNHPDQTRDNVQTPRIRSIRLPSKRPVRSFEILSFSRSDGISVSGYTQYPSRGFCLFYIQTARFNPNVRVALLRLK